MDRIEDKDDWIPPEGWGEVNIPGADENPWVWVSAKEWRALRQREKRLERALEAMMIFAEEVHARFNTGECMATEMARAVLSEAKGEKD